MAKIETTGAKEKFYHRLLCIQEFFNELDAQLTALEEAKDECCSPYEDGITMEGQFISMEGTDIEDIVGMESNP